jgi:aminoglycoside phosphotransferase family enzyme
VHPEPQLSDKVDFLRHRAWPEPPTEEVETHMSWVFLTGDRAYKLKKPVAHTFLDYRSLESRRQDCQAEVELNRVLAPGIYLGIDPLVVDTSGRLALGGDGEIVDWLVVMRRLDRENLLDRRIARGVATTEELDPVVDLLAGFYHSAAPLPMSPDQYRRELRDLIALDMEELRRPTCGLDQRLVARLADTLVERIDRTRDLDDRAARLVDGHGDLRPEHVRTGDAPLVIDRLTFDLQLRRVDPYFDLALLAVECERLGASDLARHALDGYRSRAGDPAPANVLELYQALRATTRARLSIAHLRDGDHDRRKWVDRTSSYLAIARRHLDASPHDS